VHHDTPETTPQLKLLVVVYSGNTIDPDQLPLIDGVSLWITNQNAQYTNIDSYVDHCRTFHPGKEINCGIYVANSIHGWMTPASLEHMYRRLLDRYDDGDVNGIPLFCGHWLVMPNITRERWDADRIPALLDEVYYPYVGAGRGRVLDEQGAPVAGASVTCTTVGRLSGELLVRSKKRTDADGRFEFHAWAGNRSTESTLYFAAAEKEGRVSAPVAGWIHRGGETVFPDLLLTGPAGSGDDRTEGLASVRPPGLHSSPNPLRESTVIQYAVTRGERLRMRIFNLAGRDVGTLADTWCPPGEYHVVWDGRDRSGERAPSGIYLLRLEGERGDPRATGSVLVVR
jgi:hypothetical protein